MGKKNNPEDSTGVTPVDNENGADTIQDKTAVPAKKENTSAGATPTHEFDLKIGDVVLARNGKQIKSTLANYNSIYKKAGWEIIDQRTTASEKKSS